MPQDPRHLLAFILRSDINNGLAVMVDAQGQFGGFFQGVARGFLELEDDFVKTVYFIVEQYHLPGVAQFGLG